MLVNGAILNEKLRKNGQLGRLWTTCNWSRKDWTLRDLILNACLWHLFGLHYVSCCLWSHNYKGFQAEYILSWKAAFTASSLKIIQWTLNEKKLRSYEVPRQIDVKLWVYAVWWWSIHCSQSCNDLTVFAVGSMCAEKENPKAGRSLQSFSPRLNVVQKPATTSLEMKRICCSSWACTCRRFICALKDSFYWREVYP